MATNFTDLDQSVPQAEKPAVVVSSFYSSGANWAGIFAAIGAGMNYLVPAFQQSAWFNDHKDIGTWLLAGIALFVLQSNKGNPKAYAGPIESLKGDYSKTFRKLENQGVTPMRHS